jgi:glycosyl hydrolase family 16
VRSAAAIGLTAVGLLLGHLLTGSAAGRGLRVGLPQTTSRALLDDGAVTARVRSRAATTVRFAARLARPHRRGRRIAVPRWVKLKGGRARTVRLPLTRAGRAALSQCGRTRLTVTASARHRRRGSSSRRVRCERAAVPGAPPSAAGTSPPAPQPGSAGASGVPMPVGDLPGWRQVFTDDFGGTSLDSRKWGPYTGVPDGDPGGYWDPSHIVVADDVVTLRTYRDPGFSNRWVSGGMSSARALSQTYGKYEVRFRVDTGYGVAAILLLFPTADHWPPEIDFAENGGTTQARDHMTATLHYGADDNLIQRRVDADFTKWHTIGVEWTPGRLVYTLDGRPWATVSGPQVPSEPMELDAQAQAGTAGQASSPAPNATTPPEVDMQIDWAVAYAPVPTGASARATRRLACR